VAGINRALYEQRHLAKAGNPCIFLSHISVDKSSATAIGDYIKKQGDIDIYLDLNDEDLQSAVRRDDPMGITRFIEQGLSSSTHIMCLVSAATVGSWWVPYELGFAKNAGKHLSTLKLKGEITLPAYLKISEIIPGTKTLNDFLTRVRQGLGKTAAVRSLTETLISHTSAHPLDQHLDYGG
jgi:Thoeris protein ThsB, TIR-like domain